MVIFVNLLYYVNLFGYDKFVKIFVEYIKLNSIIRFIIIWICCSFHPNFQLVLVNIISQLHIDTFMLPWKDNAIVVNIFPHIEECNIWDICALTIARGYNNECIYEPNNFYLLSSNNTQYWNSGTKINCSCFTLFI